jgi:hypothetical protein
LRFSLVSEFELIWLKRLTLPLGVLFYCTSISVALARWSGVVGPGFGVVRVVETALVGHLVAALVLAAQGLAGHALLRRLGWQAVLESRAERLLFSIIVGFVAGDAALMLLALAGALNSTVLGILAAAGAAVAVWNWRAHIASWRTSLSARSSSSTQANLLTYATGVVVIAGSIYWLWPLLVQTALPNSDWDSALYHLPLAERYLEGKLWNPDPLFSAHSFPGGVSLVYAVFLGFGFESAVIPYNFLFVLLNLVAAYAVAARLGNSRSGVWAVLICSGIHILWQQGVDPRVDGFLSLFVVTAMLALVIWLRDRSQVVPLYLLAVSLCGAIGTKYTGLFIALAFAGLVVAVLVGQRFATGRDSNQGGLSLGSALLCLSLLAIPNLAWYASNTVIHGDPLFPMLRGDYFEDAARPGERIQMTGALNPRFAELTPNSAARQRANELAGRSAEEVPANLFNLVDVYGRPNSYATKPNHFASPLLLLFILLPFAMSKAGRERAGWTALYGLTLVCFAGLASQTNLLRYTLPFLVLFGVGSALVIDRIPHPAWRTLWLVLGVATLAHHHPAEVRKLERLQPALYAELEGDRIKWLSVVGYNFTRSMPMAIGRINQEIRRGTIDPGSLILMAGEGKGRLLDCAFLPDLSWFMQRFSVEMVRGGFDNDAIVRSLRSQGVSHILYNRGYFRWVLAHTETAVEPLALAMVQLESLAQSHGRIVFKLAGIQLVELAEPAKPARF